MSNISVWFGSLPAPIRHFLAVVLGTAATFFLGRIVEAGSIYGVDYVSTGLQALDAGVLAGIGVLLVLYITPLTNAYGVGKQDPEADDYDYGYQTSELPAPQELTHPDWATDADWKGNEK